MSTLSEGNLLFLNKDAKKIEELILNKNWEINNLTSSIFEINNKHTNKCYILKNIYKKSSYKTGNSEFEKITKYSRSPKNCLF